MSKPKANPLPGMVQSFFAEYLIDQRQLSPCTISSYRDTIRLLLDYIEDQTHCAPVQQRLEQWDAPSILGFLNHIEHKRDCCVRTRNARLAGVHCFMKYVSQRYPEFLALASRVLAIPNKRHPQPLLGHLTEEQAESILQAPDPMTFSGQRDRLVFQLLYNTGARVSEVVALNRQDLQPASCRTVILHGKGRKERIVPLWPKTALQMRRWLEGLPAAPSTPVFTNRFGTRLSRFGVEKQLSEAVAKASRVCRSLQGRRISPHIFRHTVAMRLLQSNGDITTVALWLGHESPLTTYKYLEADLEMKKIALSRLSPPKLKSITFRPNDSLLSFLEAL
jgi:integrase/recombinase XerD